MKLRFLLLAVAGIGMLACAKDGAEGPAVPDGSKSIVLKIALPQTTRAITPDDPYSPLDPDDADSGTTISKIDVYFTDNNGIIQESYRIEDSGVGSNMEAIRKTGLRFTGLENVARVYCVANSNTGMIGKGNSIKSFTKKLSEQKPDMDQNASIFVGYDADITPFVADEDTGIPNYDGTPTTDVPEDGDQAYKAAVTIRPLISRIEWGKITIEESGHKVIYDNQTPAQPKYLIAWEGWQPTLAGIYQSNVYLNSKIFADATNIVDNHFATIDKDNDIVNGAWKKDTDGATLAYSDYSNPTGPYNPLIADLATYNTSGKCIPFHFFVPFDATASSISNNVNTTEQFAADKKPLWHFQLQYANKSSYKYTVYNYDAAKGEDLSQYKDADKVTDPDEVLSVSVDFIYPGNADNIAYVNVLKLLKGTDEITYQPGKIYKADITLSPFNVSGSYTEVIDYNVIVNVSVADFESEAVTPGFN